MGIDVAISRGTRSLNGLATTQHLRRIVLTGKTSYRAEDYETGHVHDLNPATLAQLRTDWQSAEEAGSSQQSRSATP